MKQSRESIRKMARLESDILLPGHGKPEFLNVFNNYDFYNICRYATHGILAILMMSLLILIGTRRWFSALWFFIGAVENQENNTKAQIKQLLAM